MEPKREKVGILEKKKESQLKKKKDYLWLTEQTTKEGFCDTHNLFLDDTSSNVTYSMNS